MKKILIVDDNKTILRSLELVILDYMRHYSESVEVVLAKSYEEANKIMRLLHSDLYIAVVDMHLPDCKAGQVAQLTSAHKIPTIILSDSEDEVLKELLTKRYILDVVKKSEPNSMKYIATYVHQIIRNSDICALVVDDSALYRKALVSDLEKIRINVLEAASAEEALEILGSAKKPIKLILTDYQMPGLNGIEFTVKLRLNYEKDELVILALSDTDDDALLAKFMKVGANDFIFKPHKFQELNVRINANLDLLDLFERTKDLANRDYLTGSYNRRFFYESAKAILDKNRRKEMAVAVAMLDIDNFKKINDTYGHDVGDVAIKEIARILNKHLRASDLVARFGGEEYAILLEDIPLKDCEALFEKIRRCFEENKIAYSGVQFSYTVSIGVVYAKNYHIDQLLKCSDEALYEAKEGGRNRVVITSDSC